MIFILNDYQLYVIKMMFVSDVQHLSPLSTTCGGVIVNGIKSLCTISKVFLPNVLWVIAVGGIRIVKGSSRASDHSRISIAITLVEFVTVRMSVVSMRCVVARVI